MYLIVKCDELSDQFECDADRTPVCLTNDYSHYGRGYEVYELLSNNTFKLIKEYDTALKEGAAIYAWSNGIDTEKMPPNKIYETYPNASIFKFTKAQIKKIKAKYQFAETVNEIFNALQHEGAYGEEVNGEWLVIGKYQDNHFDMGC